MNGQAGNPLNSNQVNHSSNVQIFCPINYYSKLTDEAIGSLIENQMKLRRLGRTLIKMHSNLCDRHELFIETHQSICTICVKFIDKFEHLILKEEEESEKATGQVDEQTAIDQAKKKDNELNDNLESRLADKDRLDKEFNLRLDKGLVDHRTNKLDKVDRNKCYYCREIELNNLNPTNIRNYYVQNSTPDKIEISIHQPQQIRIHTNQQHKRYHSDSFIKLKRKSFSDEQLV